MDPVGEPRVVGVPAGARLPPCWEDDDNDDEDLMLREGDKLTGDRMDWKAVLTGDRPGVGVVVVGGGAARLSPPGGDRGTVMVDGAMVFIISALALRRRALLLLLRVSPAGVADRTWTLSTFQVEEL